MADDVIEFPIPKSVTFSFRHAEHDRCVVTVIDGRDGRRITAVVTSDELAELGTRALVSSVHSAVEHRLLNPPPQPPALHDLLLLRVEGYEKIAEKMQSSADMRDDQFCQLDEVRAALLRDIATELRADLAASCVTPLRSKRKRKEKV